MGTKFSQTQSVPSKNYMMLYRATQQTGPHRLVAGSRNHNQMQVLMEKETILHLCWRLEQKQIRHSLPPYNVLPLLAICTQMYSYLSGHWTEEHKALNRGHLSSRTSWHEICDGIVFIVCKSSSRGQIYVLGWVRIPIEKLHTNLVAAL